MIGDEGEVLVEVWRGCKPIDYQFELSSESNVEIFSQSCSVSLCNRGMSYGPGEGAGSANLQGITSMVEVIILRFFN